MIGQLKGRSMPVMFTVRDTAISLYVRTLPLLPNVYLSVQYTDQ